MVVRRIIVDVVTCLIGDAFLEGTDVVRFTVVIPGKNLRFEWSAESSDEVSEV